MPRYRRILSETGTYHVMMRGNERRELFLDKEDKQRFIEILFSKKNEIGFSIYAYCLMDNHIHLIIREEKEDLSTIIKRINISYAFYFNQKNRRVGHLFQDRFKSEPIENDRYLLAVIRYVHNNPVKAGIVERPEEYAWSSYKQYIAPPREQSGMVEVDFVLSMISEDRKEAIKEFKQFSQHYDDMQFLDITEEPAWTVAEGEAYLKEYISKSWPGTPLDELMENKETRTQIILEMKTNVKLSVRKIADILRINRGLVQKVKTK